MKMNSQHDEEERNSAQKKQETAEREKKWDALFERKANILSRIAEITGLEPGTFSVSDKEIPADFPEELKKLIVEYRQVVREIAVGNYPNRKRDNRFLSEMSSGGIQSDEAMIWWLNRY